MASVPATEPQIKSPPSKRLGCCSTSCVLTSAPIEVPMAMVRWGWPCCFTNWSSASSCSGTTCSSAQPGREAVMPIKA